MLGTTSSGGPRRKAATQNGVPSASLGIDSIARRERPNAGVTRWEREQQHAQERAQSASRTVTPFEKMAGATDVRNSLIAPPARSARALTAQTDDQTRRLDGVVAVQRPVNSGGPVEIMHVRSHQRDMTPGPSVALATSTSYSPRPRMSSPTGNGLAEPQQASSLPSASNFIGQVRPGSAREARGSTDRSPQSHSKSEAQLRSDGFRKQPASKGHFCHASPSRRPSPMCAGNSPSPSKGNFMADSTPRSWA